MKNIAISVVCVISFGLAGCSGDDSSGAGGAGGTSGSGGSGGSAGMSGAGPVCPGPGYRDNTQPQPINSLHARVVDGAGQPAANILAQMCGTDLCINAETDANGEVVKCDKMTMVCTPGITSSEPQTKPAFKYGAGLKYVKFAQLLPSSETDHVLGDVTTFALPDMATGVTIEPGASITSGPVTLTIAAGASIDINFLEFQSDEEQRFRATAIPMASAPPAVDPALGLEMLVGMTPILAHICPAPKLSVPNSEGWAAGTEVEFYLHGVSVEEDWAPYGGWQKVSDGAVSTDGALVETAEGGGIPELSVIGIKRK